MMRLLLIGAMLAAVGMPMRSALAQSLLRIPNLNARPITVKRGKPPTSGGDSSKVTLLMDVDLIGSMDSAASVKFWGENQRDLVPGSSIGVGNTRASVFTELAQVLSGSWRISVGSALSAESGDTTKKVGADSAKSSPSLARLVAGGGNLAVAGTRPVVIAQLGRYTNFALLVLPRVWLNVPNLSSSDGVDNYGGELATSVLLQRNDNGGMPFLTFEVRAAAVAGSREFNRSLGRRTSDAFSYLAPSVTLAVRDQINLGVSTMFSSIVDGSQPLSLKLSLLRKAATKWPAAPRRGRPRVFHRLRIFHDPRAVEVDYANDVQCR